MASNPQTPRGAFGAQLKGPGYGTLNKPEDTAAEKTKEKRSSESERVGMEKKYFFLGECRLETNANRMWQGFPLF